MNSSRRKLFKDAKVEQRNGKDVVVVSSEDELHPVDLDKEIKRLESAIKNIDRNITGMQKRREIIMAELKGMVNIRTTSGSYTDGKVRPQKDV